MEQAAPPSNANFLALDGSSNMAMNLKLVVEKFRFFEMSFSLDLLTFLLVRLYDIVSLRQNLVMGEVDMAPRRDLTNSPSKIQLDNNLA